jgi:hypothetical protein
MPRGRARIERHGANHICGGSDPIPGICDFISGSGFPSYRNCVLANPALYAYYPMDETSGDLADLAGGTDAARITDLSSITYGLDGPFDTDHPDWTAILFTGNFGPSGPEDRFRRPVSGSDGTMFAGTNPWTIDGWVYPTSITSTVDKYVFSFAGGGGGTGLYLDGSPSVTLKAFRGGVTVEDPATLTLNTWTHVRVSYDGATLRLYRNGVEVDTAADAASWSTPSSSNWTIGNTDTAITSGNARPFNGRISDVAVFDDALTDFCDTVTSGGPGSEGAQAGTVLTADGAGGTEWEYPTVNVDGTRYDEIIAGTNLSSTDNSDGTVTLDATGSGNVAADTIWDAKGDLAVGTGADAGDNLTVGTNGQVLTADSTQPLGVKWATPATGVPADDDAVWMPLTTTVGGDDVLVFDADHSLIPTLVPF